jgi:hypothetical protein
MALYGTLTDLPLADLLHLLETNQLSGRLTVTNDEGHGVVVFRDGRVIYAATNGPRETVGSMLVHRKIITPSTLTEALGRQARSVAERRLGSVLLEMGVVDEETLRGLMHEQVGRVLKDLLQWRRGFVRFEALRVPEGGEIGVDARDLLVEEGLDTERVVFDVMSQLASDADDTADRLLLDALVSGRPPEPGSITGRDASLKRIMGEIRSLQFTGEVTLNILRLASGLLGRGAVFLRTADAFEGVGQFGLEDGGAAGSGDRRVRALRIPCDEPSLFYDVAEQRETYVGPLEHRYWNVHLVRGLGGGTPGQVAVVPLLVNDRVRLIFYGDNHPEEGPIGDLERLEVVMLQAGLVIEKALLEKRLQAVGERAGAVAGGAVAG